MKKQAIPGLNRLSPQMLKTIIGTLGGAAAGGFAGHEVTPHIAGYADVPEARRVSAYSDAILGAILGGALGHGGRAGLKGIGIPLKALPLAAAAGEVPPLLVAKLTKEKQLADQLAETAKGISIPQAIRDMGSSSITRGAGVGAAGAGLAGMMSGLTRRKSESELANRTGRGKMIGKDALKFLIPAMLAGGVAGSFAQPKE